MSRPTPWTALGMALAASVVLSGCGALHPGEAAVSGDVTVSSDRVDEVAGLYCDALVTVGQLTTQSAMRGYVATALATTEVAMAYADEEGIDLAGALEDARATFVAGLSQLDPTQVEAVADVEMAGAIPQLLGEGRADSYDAYLAGHPIEVNPAFGGTRVATAVTESAVTLGQDIVTALPEAAATLPADQRCGSAAS